MNLASIAIIAGNAVLAETICSRLRKSNVYLPVIEAPTVRLEQYGVFAADCIRVSNAVRALRPKTVLFLQVDPRVAERLGACFSEITPVVIETFDEHLLTQQHLKFGRSIGFSDLILADPSACSSNLIVVEGEFGLSHVIAANLAVAHGGRIISISHVSDDEIEALKEKSRTWSNGSYEEREQAKEAIIRFARERLPKRLVDSLTAQSISFITRGVPYGVLPFRCPTTHYYSFPLLGVSVLSGMLKDRSHVRCPVALLIDPNSVGKSEFETLRKTFGAAGYQLRLAYGTGATIKTATYLCQYLPCDFIFFSTH